VTFATVDAPAAYLADGRWLDAGTSRSTVAVEHAKPQPPIDEQARRDVKRLKSNYGP